MIKILIKKSYFIPNIDFLKMILLYWHLINFLAYFYIMAHMSTHTAIFLFAHDLWTILKFLAVSRSSSSFYETATTELFRKLSITIIQIYPLCTCFNDLKMFFSFTNHHLLNFGFKKRHIRVYMVVIIMRLQPNTAAHLILK